ncbi:unnamed protein product [Somion occarium]|uniref:Uncharacterized protein n=1 Tax=Somion occarium TaxID=3059160 RepID=A0ABP1DSG4_9APHY
MVPQNIRCARIGLSIRKPRCWSARNLSFAAESPSHASVEETLPSFQSSHLPAYDGPVLKLRPHAVRDAKVPPSFQLKSGGLLLAQANKHNSGPTPEPENGEEISDQEWEIRTGRAIYILQQTLPDFFSTGLVSSLDTPIVPRADGRKIEPDERSESIYSPRVRLEYEPPVALPTPLPRVLRIEGLHLYIASSVFVRHTLNALYADLHVEIRRVRLHGPPQNSSGSTPDDRPPSSSTRPRSTREKTLAIGLTVTGAGRVSGAPAQWEVNSTYTFSPTTGLIQLHTVDSIEPAPHQSIFEALGRFGLIGNGAVDNGLKGAGGAR